MEISVFGYKATQIKDGDIFIAKVDSVEGRTVVRLLPENEYIKKTFENVIIHEVVE